MNIVVKVIHSICTNKNNHDYCHSKTLSLVAFLAFLGFTTYSLYRGDKFDPAAWSGGIGAVILAGAGGAKLKQTTEMEQ